MTDPNPTEIDLQPNELAFAQAMLTHSKSDAYRVSQPRDIIAKLKPSQIHNRANKLSNKPGVMARYRELLSAAKISEMDSQGQAIADLHEFIRLSKDKNNLTAAAAFMRLRMQALNMLRDSVTVQWEATITEDELVKRVAAKNPMLAKALSASLGREDAFAA